MAEIDDLMRGAFGRAALAADGAVDRAAARQAVRRRIAAGEVGRPLQVAPGWRLARWGFAAHRVAWTALIAALAVIAAIFVIAGLRGAAPTTPGEPGTGMTTPAPVSESATTAGPQDATTDTTTRATSAQTSPASRTTTTASPSTATTPATASAAPSTMTDSSSSTPSRRTTTAAPPRTTAPTRTSAPPSSSTRPPTTAPSSTSSTKGSTTVTTTATSPPADTEAPVMLSLFSTAQEVMPGQTMLVVAQVTDDTGVTGVHLAWSGKEVGLPDGTAEMTPSQTGWVFTVAVPKLDQGGTVVFTAIARDAAGNRSVPATVAVVIRR